MTVIATCDQCGEHRVCSCGSLPVMPPHDNPETGEHCPGSDHIGLTGVQ